MQKMPATDPITEAVSNLAIPVYKDSAKPLAKQLGKAGNTVGAFVNTILAPLAMAAYAWQCAEPKVKKQIAQKIELRLGDVLPERLVSPPQRVLVPAIQSFVHAAEDEEIADMFANLLASSMNVDKRTNVHPAFVQIINSLTSDEAKLLKIFAKEKILPVIDIQLHAPNNGYDVISPYFSIISTMDNFERGELMPNYLSHLCQLGLIEIPQGILLNDEKKYVQLEEHPEVQSLRTAIQNTEKTIKLNKKIAELTTFGRQFILVSINH